MSSKVHVSGGRPPLRYDVLSINIGSAPKVHLGFLETVRDTWVPPGGTSSGFKWIYFWKKGAHESGKIWKVFGTRKDKKRNSGKSKPRPENKKREQQPIQHQRNKKTGKKKQKNKKTSHTLRMGRPTDDLSGITPVKPIDGFGMRWDALLERCYDPKRWAVLLGRWTCWLFVGCKLINLKQSIKNHPISSNKKSGFHFNFVGVHHWMESKKSANVWHSKCRLDQVSNLCNLWLRFTRMERRTSRLGGGWWCWRIWVGSYNACTIDKGQVAGRELRSQRLLNCNVSDEGIMKLFTVLFARDGLHSNMNHF